MSSTDELLVIGLLLSNDRRAEERKIQKGDEREERKRDNKDDIAPSNSALGKDGTAVSEGGKAGRQRKKKGEGERKE